MNIKYKEHAEGEMILGSNRWIITDDLSEGDWFASIKAPGGGWAIYGPGKNVRIAHSDEELLNIVRAIGGNCSSVEQASQWCFENPEVLLIRNSVNTSTENLQFNIDVDNPFSILAGREWIADQASYTTHYLPEGIESTGEGVLFSGGSIDLGKLTLLQYTSGLRIVSRVKPSSQWSSWATLIQCGTDQYNFNWKLSRYSISNQLYFSDGRTQLRCPELRVDEWNRIELNVLADSVVLSVNENTVTHPFRANPNPKIESILLGSDGTNPWHGTIHSLQIWKNSL